MKNQGNDRFAVTHSDPSIAVIVGFDICHFFKVYKHRFVLCVRHFDKIHFGIKNAPSPPTTGERNALKLYLILPKGGPTTDDIKCRLSVNSVTRVYSAFLPAILLYAIFFGFVKRF